MGGFYQGAYASPLQRQRTYDVAEAPQFDSSMADMPATSTLGGSGGGPSRFQSFLGSLSQPSDQQDPNKKRKGFLGGINTLTGGNGATQAASGGGALGLLKFLI